MNIYWGEIQRFIRQKWKKILLLALILMVAFSSLIIFQKVRNNSSQQSTTESSEFLNDDTNVGYFQFYIEYPDGYPYTNGEMLNELFSSDQMYEDVLEEISTDIVDLQEEAIELGAPEEFHVIDVEFDSSSNIYTAFFDTGVNEENLELANFYYEYLLNDNFAVLANKQIYTMELPQLLDEELLDDSQQNNEAQNTLGITITESLLTVGVSTIVGLSLSLIYWVVKENFSNKLNYSFAYRIDNSNSFLLIDSKIYKDNNIISYFIGTTNDNTVILNEKKYWTKKIKNEYDLDFREYNSLLEIEPSINTEIDEVFIIVTPTFTNRKWYNAQIKLCEMKNITPKIIQIND